MAALSVEQENYVRMSLLVAGVSPRAVRRLFDREFSPACLTQSIRRENRKIKNLYINKHINTEQLKLLQGGQLESSSFDVQLMICLLRNLTNIQGPRTGYDVLPQPSDQCAGADLARLKYYRNFTAHVTDDKIDTSYFNTAWDDICNAIERLGDSSMKDECDKLKHGPIDRSSVEILKEVKQLLVDLTEARKDIEDLTDEMLEMNMDNEYNFKKRKVESNINLLTCTEVDALTKQYKYKTNVFIETNSFVKILDAIENHQCVIVTGPPGCGKFINASKAVDMFRKPNTRRCDYQSDITLLLKRKSIPPEYDLTMRMEDTSRTRIHVIDGFFGKCSFNERNYLIWKENLHKIRRILRSKHEKLIITCRSDILRFVEGKLGIPFYHCPVLYSEAEINQIYQSFMKTDENISLPEDPALCALIPAICSLSDYDLILKNIASNSNVVEFIEREVNRVKGGSIWDYKALVLLCMMNNTLDKDIFRKTTHSYDDLLRELCLDRVSVIKEKIQRSLSSLVGTFIEETSTEYSFKYQWQFDYIVNFVGKENLEIMIDHSNSNLIRDKMILLTDNSSEAENNSLSIKIPFEMKEAFEKRLIQDFRKGHLWNVLSNCYDRLSELKKIAEELKIRGHSIRDKNDKSTCLHITAWFGCTDLAKVLIKNDQSLINAKDSSQNTPIYYASAMGYVEIVHSIIQKNTLEEPDDTEFEPSNWSGKTALHIACENEHYEVVKLLLEYMNSNNGKDIVCCDPLLHIACKNGNSKIAQLLISHNMSVNYVFNLCTPLHMAACNGHTDIVRMLLTENASVNGNDTTITPLCIAALYGHKEIVDILLQKFAIVNPSLKCSLTPLYAASKNNYADIVEVLLKHNAIVDTRYEDVTALGAACEGLHDEVIDVLLKHNADMENCKDKSSALHLVCKTNRSTDKTTIIEKLLKKNVNINKLDAEGNTPLEYTLNNSDFNSSRILIQNGATVNHSHKLGSHPLLEACTAGQMAMVEFLLKNDTKTNVNLKDNNGNTALNALCSSRAVYSTNLEKQNVNDILELLLFHQADVTEFNKDGHSPFTSACKAGLYYFISPLLKHDRSLLNRSDAKGNTPLFIACLNNQNEVVDCLLEYGININKKCADGATALHAIISYILEKDHHRLHLNKNKLLTKLVDLGADVNITDKNKNTVIHRVSESDDTTCAQILLTGNPDLTIKNMKGFTPLHSACNNGHVDMVDCLLRYWTYVHQVKHSEDQDCNDETRESKVRFDKSIINESDNEGRVPLHFACMRGNISIVELLLRYGAIIDMLDKDKCTPLYLACERHEEIVVHFLLKNGANTNLPCSKGWTALHASCSVGNERISRLLLQNGAYTSIEDVNGFTARQIASRMGYHNIEEMFIRAML